jgi:hypothetical protein
LRQPPADVDTSAAAQFIERVTDLADETAAIENAEAEMDAHLFDLYALTPEERFLVEKDRTRRGRA